MAKIHLTIATRDGVSVPLCGNPARNIRTTSFWGCQTCDRCSKRMVQLDRMPRLDQIEYMEEVVDDWEWARFVYDRRRRNKGSHP